MLFGIFCNESIIGKCQSDDYVHVWEQLWIFHGRLHTSVLPTKTTKCQFAIKALFAHWYSYALYNNRT